MRTLIYSPRDKIFLYIIHLLGHEPKYAWRQTVKSCLKHMKTWIPDSEKAA